MVMMTETSHTGSATNTETRSPEEDSWSSARTSRPITRGQEQEAFERAILECSLFIMVVEITFLILVHML